MPVVTLQVGQCGNQLGQSLWQLFDRQCSTSPGSTDLQEASQFFKLDQQGKRQARCLLIDTEPKVVHGILKQDSQGIFSKSRSYLGQSGRGNNWAFGYHQLLSGTSTRQQQQQQQQAAARGSGVPQVPWNSSALVEDPSQEEHHILEQVVEGIQQECEQCDGAPDFLLLHSLGGGSGSGLGSAILEHLREQYPLNNIATVSVVPRAAGDSPMQSLNSVLALSFLQAYADVVMLFDNQEMIDAAGKGSAMARGVTMQGVNNHIAHQVLGAVWPLQPLEAYGGTSRIRDMVNTVAADVCCKLVETRTAAVPPNTPTASTWQDACKAVHHQYCRFDRQDGERPVTTSGALLLARGFPETGTSAGDQVAAAAAAYVKAAGGRAAFMGQQQQDCQDLLHVRSGACTLAASSRSGKEQPPQGHTHKAVGPATLTSVANRSSVVGLLGNTVDRATSIWQAGAYLHWYNKYGCRSDAVRCAIEQVSDVVDCYRAAHDIQDWLEDG